MMENKDQEILLDYIKQLLYNTDEAKLCRDCLSESSANLADGLEYLGEIIKDEKNILTKMANGDIDASFEYSHHYLAAPVKSIQSNLKHLAWVAQRVAAGDYQQSVSSLGRFSDSFNEMIRQLDQYRHKMEQMSNTDVLTGVGNRRAFNLMSEKLWQQGKNCAISFIDIDGLKYCNDNYGHSKGDEYIHSLCQLLKEHLKDDEFIYRLGGDEFLILSQSDNASKCEKRLIKIYHEFNEQMKQQVSYPCGFSFGCVDVIKKTGITVSEYLSLADQKMYLYKMKHHQNRASKTDFIDKAGLNSRFFEALSKNTITQYIFVCNMETHVSRWSVKVVKDFGLPAEYLKDAFILWQDYIHQDDLADFKVAIKEIEEGKREHNIGEFKARLKDGHYRKCRFEGSYLPGRAEEPTLFAGCIICL